MGGWILYFHEIDRTGVSLVGGKGAHLGELSRIDDLRVPPGFCVTTDAFRRALSEAPGVDDLLDRLARVGPNDREAIRTLGAEIRAALEGIGVPEEVASAIGAALVRMGEQAAYAVRSSATAEDLPTASFAGQHDSYLDVVGREAVMQRIRHCWASLFTERAVAYRAKNGFDPRQIHMAVVVQRMVPARSAGVLFTADPVTGNRKVSCVEAVAGLGEALVSGRVNPDVHHVRDGEVVSTRASGERAVLSDEQVVRLAALGRRIEAHFGRPQDVEWCLADDDFHVVQSRAITTLFPIPETGDEENHVYLSVGHQQMMTDPMKPLGMSVWQLITPRPMAEAGGRLFVDVTAMLASPASRERLLGMMQKTDPLTRDAIETVLKREDFIRSTTDDGSGSAPASGPAILDAANPPIETDPAIVAELIAGSRTSLATLKREIRTKSGPELFDFILQDVQELRRFLFAPRSMQVIMAGMEATWWLNEKLEVWLGEKNAADVLTQSAPGNVTSEMGLALLDVADVIRPHAEVGDHLRSAEDEDFLDGLAGLEGGGEAREAIRAWLDRYGMRCVGEIDITKPRWSERPTALVPILLANVKNFEPGEAERRFSRGLREARQRESELLARLRALPDGDAKAEETKRRIERLRTFVGYREYPKYHWVNRTFVYKKALMDEAVRLVEAGVLRERDDAFWLGFQELHDVVRTHQADVQLIRDRREAFSSYEALTPPRVLTSEGECIAGTHRHEGLPPGALAGLPVSAGTIEGRARVILDMAEADVEPGDILVTAYTDPSWTPLFVTVAGLVTEVGGMMTHGAVIAREYGLPGVVGVQNATRLIRDGQRIRVHGTEGWVEIRSTDP